MRETNANGGKGREGGLELELDTKSRVESRRQRAQTTVEQAKGGMSGFDDWTRSGIPKELYS
jgi:hypothetical protein